MVPLLNAFVKAKLTTFIFFCGCRRSSWQGKINSLKRLDACYSAVRDSHIARLIRQHNDANVLVIPGRFMEEKEAKNCVQVFIDTDFESGRHKQRIEKI